MRYLTIVFLFAVLYASAQQQMLDQVYLKNGEKTEGYLMEIKYPAYIRVLEDGNYLETYFIKNIDSLVQNTQIGEVSDVIILKSRERISGELLKIETGGNFFLIHDILKDTIVLPDSLILENKHSKKLVDKHLQKNYLGVYHYISISPGIGLSYGGLGGRIQYRLGREFGIGVHVGGGLTLDSFWGAGPRYNFGLKLFFLTYFYIDGSYGSIGTYYKKVYPYTQYDEKSFNYNGFSILAGVDYFFNKRFGVNFAFGAKLPQENKNIGWEEAVDVGVIFKLSINQKRKNQ